MKNFKQPGLDFDLTRLKHRFAGSAVICCENNVNDGFVNLPNIELKFFIHSFLSVIA